MDNTHGWPASAVVTASVLAVAAVGGWFETSIQSHARSAIAHSAEEQRAGLQARVTALGQDLSHANAQAQAFALQAKNARADTAAAQQRATTLADQLADAQSQEKRALAADQLRIDALKAARTDRRAVVVHVQPQGASNITAASVKSDVAPELPLPDLPHGATGRDYLVAAQQSIRAGHLGKAQACLERAETRFLNVTNPARPTRIRRQEVADVEHALDQIGADDRHGALKTVDHLLSGARA
jgi:hypothetical protein